MDALTALRELNFFDAVQDAELAFIAEHLERERHHAGSRLIEENMAGRGLYLVVEGEVRVVKESPTGRVLTLAVLRPGDFFGEMSLFDGGPHSATVIAATDCLLMVMRSDAFLELMEVDPVVALKITVRVAKVLSFRLRTANERLGSSLKNDGEI